MYNLVKRYLARLPASLQEEEVMDEDGTVTKVKRCVYTPHSLRATTTTLLLDAGVDIIKVFAGRLPLFVRFFAMP